MKPLLILIVLLLLPISPKAQTGAEVLEAVMGAIDPTITYTSGFSTVRLFRSLDSLREKYAFENTVIPAGTIAYLATGIREIDSCRQLGLSDTCFRDQPTKHYPPANIYMGYILVDSTLLPPPTDPDTGDYLQPDGDSIRWVSSDIWDVDPASCTTYFECPKCGGHCIPKQRLNWSEYWVCQKTGEAFDLSAFGTSWVEIDCWNIVWTTNSDTQSAGVPNQGDGAGRGRAGELQPPCSIWVPLSDYVHREVCPICGKCAPHFWSTNGSMVTWKCANHRGRSDSATNFMLPFYEPIEWGYYKAVE